ncbi:MAG: DUF4976 domain-containing protein, partial [Candidatus Poribacteria bacterium]|nr:DUF4976 domain-containing protein [Candidatus Poribacteria bacterium]
ISCLGDEISIGKHRFDDTHLDTRVDLFPTICDYAGVDPPEDVQGMSLRPLTEGKDVSWREYAYIESNYWGRAIVTDEYKYVTEYKPKTVEDFFPPGPNAEELGLAQLFDRHNDPWETKNLADAPEYQEVFKTCREKLLTQESQLNRQQIVHQGPQRIISNWGKRLREYWEHGKIK